VVPGVTSSVISAVAVVLAVFLIERVSTLRRQLRAERRNAAALEKELGERRRQIAQIEADQQLVTRFLRELPHVAHEMHAGANVRKIPGLLLICLVRVFEPQQAFVAVRRRSAESDPGRRFRFAVAASFPEKCAVTSGTEFALGEGEVGFAAEVQRVMDRRDFEGLNPSVQPRLREKSLPGFTPDLVAPLVFGGDTVGVVALQGVRRSGVDPKDVLRLTAQVGALAMHSLAQFTELKATANLDGLTGIFNKSHLTQRLAEEIQLAHQSGAGLSVFLFDLDHFKHYNDHNGHVAGDILLRQLAKLVQENVRNESTFGRFGGEEFLLILPGTPKEKALAAADGLRRLIAEHAFGFAAAQPLGCISVSGGVAEYPADGMDAAALLRAADEGLYAAKHGGRNRVLAYVPRYLGGDEALQPVAEPEERERLLLHTTRTPGEPAPSDAGGAHWADLVEVPSVPPAEASAPVPPLGRPGGPKTR